MVPASFKLFAAVLVCALVCSFVVSNGQETDLLLTLDPLSSNETGEYYAVHNESFRVACIATSKDPNLFVFWKRKDGNPSSLITDIDSSASGSGGSSQYSGEFVPPLCPPSSGSGDSGSGLPSSSGSGGLPSSSGSGGLPSSSGSSSLPNSSQSGDSALSIKSTSGSGGLPSSSQSGDSALPSSSGSGDLLYPSESGENDSGFSSGSGYGSSGDMSSSASGDGSASGCVSASGMVFTKAALLEANLQRDGGIECSDAGQYECVAGLYTETDIVSLDINITVTGVCCGEEIVSLSSTYIWPETSNGSTVVFMCPENTNFSVSRDCSDEGEWQDFDQDGCGVLGPHLDFLINTTSNLTNETVGIRVETLSRVVMDSQGREIDHQDQNLGKIAEIFSSISNHIVGSNMMINMSVVHGVVQTVDALTQWTPAAIEANSSSTILESFEDLASHYAQQIPINTTQVLNFTSLTFLAERLSIETLKQTGRRFAAGNELTTAEGTGATPGQLLSGEKAAIHLPPSLFEIASDAGMFFGLYETATLFPVSGHGLEGKEMRVISPVLAATVGQNLNIANLEEPVTVAFKSVEEGEFVEPDSEKCVTWNFDHQDWTTYGCNTSIGENETVVCHCNHLTNFAVIATVCLNEADCAPVTTTEPTTTDPFDEELIILTETFNNLTEENVEEAVSNLTSLVAQSENDQARQTSDNLNTFANYFDSLATFAKRPGVKVNSNVRNNAAQVVSSLIQWSPENVVVESSSRVVNSFETVLSVSAQQVPLNTVENLTVPSLTVFTERKTVENLVTEGRSLVTGEDISEAKLGSSYSLTPGELTSDELGAIILPRSLFNRVGTDDIGAFFGVYDSTSLFPVGAANADKDENSTRVTQTGSFILTATVGGDSLAFDELSEPVSVTLRLTVNESDLVIPGSEKCATWDFDLQDWTTRGCSTKISEDGQLATCTCNHLTNFCVLVDICLRQDDCEESRPRVERALTYISYIGMPISIASLVLTIVTMTMFKSIRQKDVSKFHIQLSLALFLLLTISLAFVVLSAEDITTAYAGCAFVSVLVHYFALASVTWMGAEALLMFQKLVIVFVQITTKYIVILSIVCWAAPVLPIFITLVVDLANGHDIKDDLIVQRENKPSFCFLSHHGAFWGAFLAPLLAIMVFNAVVFVCVIVVLVKHVKNSASLKKQSVSKKESLRLVFSIGGVMFLFGLTWLFAILTFSENVMELREAFQILFTIFNSFQGLFLFIFVCVMSSDVRDEWRNVFKIDGKSSKAKMRLQGQKSNPNATKTTSALAQSKTSTSTLPLPPTTSEANRMSLPWIKNEDRRESESDHRHSVFIEVAEEMSDEEEKVSDPVDDKVKLEEQKESKLSQIKEDASEEREEQKSTLIIEDSSGEQIEQKETETSDDQDQPK